MVTSLRRGRYSNHGWWYLDLLSCLLTVPLQHVASLTISVYIFTCFDRDSVIHRILRYFLLGPLMIILSLLLLPFAIIGYILWMVINALADVQPFKYVSPEDLNYVQENEFTGKVTMCSANICLAPEYICRYNNQRNVYWRLFEIGERLLYQEPSLNKPNLIPPVLRENVILSELPDVDVIILQEVFDRTFSVQLYNCLEQKYPFCIYDVGSHTFLGNHGGLGSGLFLASKHPVLDAKFLPFSSFMGYAKFVGLGVLVAKLDLGVTLKDGRQQRAVGYIATLHAQAYQGPYKIIAEQLLEADTFIESFKKEHAKEDEIIAFTVMGGDFNFDNLSPGDSATQNSPIWNHYSDPCRNCAGKDNPWTIGTEHRQPKMNHPIVQDRHAFREALLDDVQRRHFVLDADVVEQTTELMYSAPKCDAEGNVTAVEYGGRRRIDHLICHEKSLLVPTGFWFSSVLAGLSDHIPVILMLEYAKD